MTPFARRCAAGVIDRQYIVFVGLGSLEYGVASQGESARNPANRSGNLHAGHHRRLIPTSAVNAVEVRWPAGSGINGALCSDRFSAYVKYHSGAAQFCWARLKRTLLGMFEFTKSTAVERFCRDALAEHARQFRLWHKFRGGHINRRQLIPTNNRVGRALRTGVQWRKICFGNRSANGELATARLLTIAETCQLRGHNVLAYLSCALNHKVALRGHKVASDGRQKPYKPPVGTRTTSTRAEG